MKTPEKLALDWIANNRVESMPQPVTSAFLAGYQAAAPQWISVKDRLPENDNEVLIVASGEVTTAFYEAGDFGWSYGTTGYETTITHWMPLPKPPEE